MAPGSTGRTDGEEYQGPGRPPQGVRRGTPRVDPRAGQQRELPSGADRRPPEAYREAGREVPRPRPPQDRAPRDRQGQNRQAQDRRPPAEGGSGRDDYATPARPARPARPQPRRDPSFQPRDPRDTRAPQDPSFQPRDPRSPRDPSFQPRDPSFQPRDPRSPRDPSFQPWDPSHQRRPAPPQRAPRGNDIIFEVESDRFDGGRTGGHRTVDARRPDPYDDFDEFTDGWDDADDFDDDEEQGGRRREPRSKRGKRRMGRLTPAQRRRRILIRRTIAGALALFLVVTGYSITTALTRPGNENTQARLAEWARDHSLGWAVSWMENAQYKADPPKVGGTLAPDQQQELAPPTSVPTLAKGQSVLQPMKPFVPNPDPGEGVWSPAVVVNGIPVVQTAKLRSDPQHTQYLSAVSWMDQKHAKFILHAGSQEPGGTFPDNTDHITAAQMPGLLATWNGAFRVANGDSKGGFYLNGKTVGTLVPGKAAEVLMKDGTMKIGAWGRDVTMTPDVAGVRQNLTLLVDNGQVNPQVDSNDGNLWGITVNNAYFVWRSGVGITADGDIVYAMGPALSVRTLAELLQRAGAVRGMELDINMEWTSYMYYNPTPGSTTPTPTKLLPSFKRTPTRYFSTDERDFVAVYSR